MSELGSRLNELRARALSPDKQVRAMIKGRGQPTVSFAEPGDYASYQHTPVLAEQVSVALNRVVEGAEKARREIIARHSRVAGAGQPHWDATMRRMYEDVNTTPVEGRSPRNLVRVSTAGLKTWHVRIRPDALEQVGASEFCAEVNTAILEAAQQYTSALRRAKTETLGDLRPQMARSRRS